MDGDPGVGGITRDHKGRKREARLGPILCWAIVFADIGTSVYYVPGILYANVGSLAGFFVFMTMSVFVLLALKYAEVTHRFPYGGGVVTVAAQAMNHWVGALGGMFILVDFFLTAAISSLSGMLYLSVVVPALKPFALLATVVTLLLLGTLNWYGISASAKVSLIGASVAFLSDVALLITVFSHLSFSQFLALFPSMFAGHALSGQTILIGFAGSFLAFSGLESISQLSPAMKAPRKRVGGIALALVVITVGLTSPLLTMFSTLLLPKAVVEDPLFSSQVISLLGGRWGNIALQTEVAVSASALLVFASNTAIIGTYYVFMALARMRFFPSILLRKNARRGTPHYAILLATVIPIMPLLLVDGQISLLGDMYAFGLLAAFTLTCFGLDIVRYRERSAARGARPVAVDPQDPRVEYGDRDAPRRDEPDDPRAFFSQDDASEPELPAAGDDLSKEEGRSPPYSARTMLDPWHTFKFYIGLLTTGLVFIAWATNLVAKPLATAFGGTITIVGMGIAYYTYTRQRREERLAVSIIHTEEYLPGSTLAVLLPDNRLNSAIIRSALAGGEGKTVVFLYLGLGHPKPMSNVLQLHDPYYDDEQAQNTFGVAKQMAHGSKGRHLFLYRQSDPYVVQRVGGRIHPYDTIIAAEEASRMRGLSPDLIRYEVTPDGKIAHLLKRWSF